MDGIIILGAAGLAKEFSLYVKRAYPNYKNFIFVNDLDDGQTSIEINGIIYPVIKNWEFEYKYPFIVAVGSPNIKEKLVNKAISSGLLPHPTIIDPSSHILMDSSNFGYGGMISPGCVVTTNVKLGNFVTLNLNTTVGHDTNIGDYCTTNPGVHISGQCEIGKKNEFGTGCIVRDRLTIGNNKTFGAQSAVVKNITGNDPQIFIGVPSKELIK